MIETPTPAPVKQTVHWPSVLAAAGGILTILILAGGAVLFFVSGLASAFSLEAASGETVMLLSCSVTGILISILLLPAVILAVRRLSGQPGTPGRAFQRVFGFNGQKWVWLAFPALVVGGYFLNSIQGLDLVLLPVVNVLALSLPVAWLVWLGTKNLPQASLQRNWTVFGLGMTVSPLLIVILELMAMLIGLILFSILAVTVFPDLADWLKEIAGVFEMAATTLEVPEEALIELVQSPVVIAVLLLFTAGLVPLVEESIKPLGVWLLSGRPLTPADGWVLGLLSGAGFALIENLGNLAVGQGWTFLVLARAGAAGLHMFNSAIIGYTFVLSRQRKRWRPFILAFLGTVGLHALWNSVAVLATLRSVTDPSANSLGWPPVYLAILAVASLVTFTAIDAINRRLAGTNIMEYAESENNSND